MDIPQKENQKIKMNNQPPENNTPQDDPGKTENVFQSAKKSKISNWASWTILWVAVLAAGGAVWYYSDLNQKQTEKKQATYPLDIVIKALPAEEAIQFLYKGKVSKITYSEEYKNSILIGHVNFILKDGRNFISGPIPHILSAVERCGEPCNDLEKVLIPKNSILNTCGPEPPAACSANTRLTCLDGKWECREEKEEKQKIIGKIIFSDIEGGCWGFQSDNGNFFLIGGDDKSEEIKKISDILSKNVEIQGKIEKDIVSYCPVGDGLFELESYRIISDNATNVFNKFLD